MSNGFTTSVVNEIPNPETSRVSLKGRVSPKYQALILKASDLAEGEFLKLGLNSARKAASFYNSFRVVIKRQGLKLKVQQRLKDVFISKKVEDSQTS